MEESNIEITVKFTTQSMPITISHESTVQCLKTLLVPLTTILPLGQKLIFKGRLLENDKSLSESGVNNGAKIMLVGTKGLHLWFRPTMGENRDFKVDKSRIKRWKGTNIVALAECNLKEIPDEVWHYAPFVRILDVSKNSIQHVPDRIDCLTGLKKLSLKENGLSDESISWRRLTTLKHLQVLSLSQNCFNSLPSTLGLLTSLQYLHVANNNLNTLPSTLGLLTSLRHLHVANNKLTSLPIEIGNLTKLEVLKVNNNRISSIPSNIGNCTSLIEVDLSSNHLSELPDEFCSLHNLKALLLSNNAMKSLPNSLFRMCPQLLTLDLHNTEITTDTLWQYGGWEDFDQRRRVRRRKLIHYGVIYSTESDEDADKN